MFLRNRRGASDRLCDYFVKSFEFFFQKKK